MSKPRTVKQRQAGNASTLLWVTEELGMVFIDAEEPAKLAALP